MFIIQNNPELIKQWDINIQQVSYKHPNQPAAVQKYIQKGYMEKCILYERRLLEAAQSSLNYPYSKSINAFRLISSSNVRRFAINDNDEIVLRLYQIRAMNQKHREDILVEPFYPGDIG